jgi:acyl transferase domain-containing protein/acyl carrier protein
MIGHSIGEYVAATLAGVFSLADALALVATRGKLMQQLEPGAMLAVSLSAQEVEPLLNAELSLAASNAPSLCVVSGSITAVAALENRLTNQGVDYRRLHTSHAFHSQMMDEIVAPFTQYLQKVKLNTPQIPFISNVTGTWMTANQATDPNYWGEHLRQTVRFSEGMTELLQQPERVLLEVGPGRTLSTLAKRHQVTQALVLSSLRHPQEQIADVEFILNTLSRLWLTGVQIDWTGFYQDERRQRVPLPTYPFERQRYWIAPILNSGSISEPKEQLKTVEFVFSPQSRFGLTNPYVAPTNEIERRIATLYQELLGIEQVGIDDNFFDLGGHSLLGLQLISQLRKDFDVEMSLRPLFEAPTVSELALVIEEMLIAQLEELPEDTVQQLVSAT